MHPKTYKYDKFDHFQNKIIEGLEFVENFDFAIKLKICETIAKITRKDLPKESNFFKDLDKFSFTDFKNEISTYLSKKLKETDRDKVTVLNYIKMAQLKQSKGFTIYGSTKFEVGTKIEIELPQDTYDFNYFKKEISLPDFLTLYGFKLDKKDSSRNSIKMKNEETGEVLLVKKNPKENFIIWDPQNDVFSASTIIDFVLEKHKNDYPDRPFNFNDVSILLNDFVHGKQFVPAAKSGYKMEAEKAGEDKFSNEKKNLKPLKERSFLHSRGIEDSVLDSPVFKGRVYSHVFVDQYGNKHENTAFPLIGEKGMVAISKRNVGFKGMVGEKENGIFISNDLTKGEEIDKIIIVESAIDAISHYQINIKELKNQKIRYISTEGAFSEKQTELISQVIDKQSPKEVCFAQDNDLAGAHEATKMLSNLRLDDKFLIGGVKKYLVFVNPFRSKQESFIDVTFFHEPLTLKDVKKKGDQATVRENQAVIDKAIEKRTQVIDSMLGFFESANGELKGPSNEKPVFQSSVSYESNHILAHVHVTFNDEQRLWEKVNQFIIAHKFMNHTINFRREIPVAKDFNDDLKAMKGLDEVKTNNNMPVGLIEPERAAKKPKKGKILKAV